MKKFVIGMLIAGSFALPGTTAFAGGCAGGAPVHTETLGAPGPGDPEFDVLVKQTATDHPKAQRSSFNSFTQRFAM